MSTNTPVETSNKAVGRPERANRLEGFIDDGVMRSRISESAYQRQLGGADELALSSTEDDFAGWNLPKVASFRAPEVREPEPLFQPAPAFLVHPKPVPPKPQTQNKFLAAAKRGFLWWLGFSVALVCTVAGLAAFGLIQFGGDDQAAPAPLLKQDDSAPESVGENSAKLLDHP